MSSRFPGTFIPTKVASSDKMNHLIDALLTPRLLAFRQIRIEDEPAELLPDKVTWRTTFGNWLRDDSCVTIRRNSKMVRHIYVKSIDWELGRFQMAQDPDLDGQNVSRDTMEVTYQFDYFPVEVLEGLYTAAVSVVNATAVGPATSYTIDNAPTNWEGVVTDLAFAMCMERLLLDYDLWRYRLVFAVGPTELEGGGGDIANQIQVLKQNAEDRANKTMDNPLFKCGQHLAPPTQAYFASIRGFGASMGQHGVPFLSGRLRGWKNNKYV